MSAGRSSLTDCGLPGIRRIPYGVHMCHFYASAEALADALVPYFAAGLAGNERCIWITADPLPAVDAKRALAATGFDVHGAIAQGRLTVRDFSDWYAAAGRLKGNEVVDLWIDEEQRALAAGYSGLRITGNTSFLTSADWALFMDYEALVQKSFAGRRIVTLCSYHLERCGAAGVLDVVRRHACTLDRPDEGWQILTGEAA